MPGPRLRKTCAPRQDAAHGPSQKCSSGSSRFLPRAGRGLARAEALCFGPVEQQTGEQERRQVAEGERVLEAVRGDVRGVPVARDVVDQYVDLGKARVPRRRAAAPRTASSARPRSRPVIARRAPSLATPSTVTFADTTGATRDQQRGGVRMRRSGLLPSARPRVHQAPILGTKACRKCPDGAGRPALHGAASGVRIPLATAPTRPTKQPTNEATTCATEREQDIVDFRGCE